MLSGLLRHLLLVAQRRQLAIARLERLSQRRALGESARQLALRLRDLRALRSQLLLQLCDARLELLSARGLLLLLALVQRLLELIVRRLHFAQLDTHVVQRVVARGELGAKTLYRRFRALQLSAQLRAVRLECAVLCADMRYVALEIAPQLLGRGELCAARDELCVELLHSALESRLLRARFGELRVALAHETRETLGLSGRRESRCGQRLALGRRSRQLRHLLLESLREALDVRALFVQLPLCARALLALLPQARAQIRVGASELLEFRHLLRQLAFLLVELSVALLNLDLLLVELSRLLLNLDRLLLELSGLLLELDSLVLELDLLLLRVGLLSRGGGVGLGARALNLLVRGGQLRVAFSQTALEITAALSPIGRVVGELAFETIDFGLE